MAAEKMLATNGSRPKMVDLAKIRLDGDTQSREELDQDVIKEYADLMADGVEFPPITVTFDGASYWLVDGFHRRWAAMKAKVSRIRCLVIAGTLEDARWQSYGANRDHGLPRSTEDKRKAIVSALKHPNGAGKADSKIAEHVGVDHSTVAKYRKQLEATCEIRKSTDREGRDGRVIETANIGGSASRKARAKTTPDEAAIKAVRKAENRLVVARALIDICEPCERMAIAEMAAAE